MGSAHTPGPWVPTDVNRRGAAIRIGDSTAAPVADIYSVSGEWAEVQANAKLVCAAPDLADALQAFLLAFPHSADHALDAQQLAAVKSASAALLKAGRLE